MKGAGWGLRRHLRDRQRGGMGEAVAVADDELVERQLGITERSGARYGMGTRRDGRRPGGPARGRRDATTGEKAARPPRVPRGGGERIACAFGWTISADEL